MNGQAMCVGGMESVQPLNYVPFFNRVSGTGGLMFRAWWGRMLLYCLSHALIAVWACFVVTNHSAFKISRLSRSSSSNVWKSQRSWKRGRSVSFRASKYPPAWVAALVRSRPADFCSTKRTRGQHRSMKPDLLFSFRTCSS